MASNFQDKLEREDMFKFFRNIDKDGDGKITKEELLSGLITMSYFTVNIREKVEDIFERLDTDKSGIIDYTEFITAATD